MAHSTRCIAVAGKGNRPQIEAYLYNHTSISEWTQVDGTFFALLTTVAAGETRGVKSFDEAQAIREDRAQYLATYQAERLTSGLYFARVFKTRQNALSDPDVVYCYKQVRPVGTVVLVAPGPAEVLNESFTVLVREDFADRVRAIINTGATVYGERYDRVVVESLNDITRNTRQQDAEVVERYVRLCEERLGIPVES